MLNLSNYLIKDFQYNVPETKIICTVALLHNANGRAEILEADFSTINPTKN
jgi:hypothetical protein